MSRGGLATERTGLAWGRTALGVLANAALLAVRDVAAAGPARAAAPITLAVLIALGAVLIGRRRDATLRRSALPARLALARTVPLIGWSVAALALLSGAVLLR